MTTGKQGVGRPVETRTTRIDFAAMLYLWFGRKNIMPLNFAHGISNSLGQTFRFLGIRE